MCQFKSDIGYAHIAQLEGGMRLRTVVVRVRVPLWVCSFDGTEYVPASKVGFSGFESRKEHS